MGVGTKIDIASASASAAVNGVCECCDGDGMVEEVVCGWFCRSCGACVEEFECSACSGTGSTPTMNLVGSDLQKNPVEETLVLGQEPVTTKHSYASVSCWGGGWIE